MISYMPYIYSDELIYSLFSRWYVKSGYTSYIDSATELYVKKTIRPDFEFINLLKPEVINLLEKNIGMDTIVNKHTMFPLYGRFIPLERRIKGYEAVRHMIGNYRTVFAMPINKRHLRYCPGCVKEDREQFGETYWHRTAQIPSLNICAKHRCRLITTDINMGGNKSPQFIFAESRVPENDEIIDCNDTLEIQLAEYLTAVFNQPVNMTNNSLISQVLDNRIRQKYLKGVGLLRNLEQLYAEYQAYYKSSSINNMTQEHLQKILSNKRVDFYEVCQLAVFLDISVNQLVSYDASSNCIINTTNNRQIDQIFIAVSNATGYDSEVVKTIGEAIINKYDQILDNNKKTGKKAYDWDTVDKKLLRQVKVVASEIYGVGDERPHKVTVSAIAKRLGIDSKKLIKLPRCMVEINKYEETQEEYWMREVKWATRKLENDGTPICWKRIRELTNLDKKDLLRCGRLEKDINKFTQDIF